MTDIAAWWAYVVRYEAREMWRALPGPWPVKVLVLVVLAAIPGEIDEFLFLAVLAAFRKRQAVKVKISSEGEAMNANTTGTVGTVVVTTNNCEIVLDARGFYVRCFARNCGYVSEITHAKHVARQWAGAHDAGKVSKAIDILREPCQQCGMPTSLGELMFCGCGCGLICWDRAACSERINRRIAWLKVHSAKFRALCASRSATISSE